MFDLPCEKAPLLDAIVAMQTHLSSNGHGIISHKVVEHSQCHLLHLLQLFVEIVKD